jgi:hypothetical protein
MLGLLKYKIAAALAYCGVLLFSACLATPSSGNHSPGGQSMPEWVKNPYSKYDNQRYVAATGSGRNDKEAKNDALSNLVKHFGQSVQVDQRLSTRYSEAVRNGVTASWTESTALQENISTYAANTLISAEVPETVQADKNTWYAVAVMDKAKTGVIYSDLINTNQAMIGNLINMNQKDKASIEGFSRYYLAAVTADINMSFGNVLKVTGSPVPAGLKNGDEYWLEAANIAKSIPVMVAVEKRADVDRAGSIRNAFSRALSEIGFITAADSALYTLEVNLTLTEVNYPDRQSEFISKEIDAKFARYEVSANLTDSKIKIGLLPVYSISGDLSHSTLQEAENRALSAAERKINEQYKDWLSGQLTQRLSRR